MSSSVSSRIHAGRWLVLGALALVAGGVAGDASAATSCNDNNPCTTDKAVSGVCKFTPVAKGTSCSDGDPCNGTETCDGAGKCLVTTPAAIDDKNPCTTDTCTKSGGIKHTRVATGTSCSDGNACNGAETCNSSGVCVAGKAPALDDGNPCTADSCDSVKGVLHTPLPAGTSCSDGNACNGAETCNGAGSCVAGAAPVLDDGNPCTFDSCSPSGGVTHVPEVVGTSCADSDPCNGTERCDSAGKCLAGVPISANDGNPCTVDSCDPINGIRHLPVAVGTSCSDGNVCNGAETCNASGVCAAGAAPSLDDGNPCTVDACTSSGGITHTPAKAGTSCADANPCNGTESCNATGQCVAGSPTDVDDGNPCTLDTCTQATGVTHAPLVGGSSCSDGNLCNGDEVCDGSGLCLAGTPVPLSDDNPCTVDTCDAKLGVLHQPASPTCEGTAASWSLVLAGRPSPRDSAAAAYDTVGRRTVLFGGESAGVAMADTWVWDGSAWKTSAYLAGPSARAAASMVFDSDRGKMILFGGASRMGSGEVYFGDTWELDLGTLSWTRRVVSGGPSARSSASMGFDPNRHRVIMFGGVGASGDLDDTWEWDGAAGTWAIRTTTTTPPKRAGAAFVFHRARGVLTLAGGARFASGAWGVPLDDVWDFDGNDWIARDLTAKPSARSGGAMSTEPSAALLFGGTSPGTPNLADLWAVDTFGAWKQASASAEVPSARAGHVFLFDAGRARHMLFGGLSFSDTGLHTTNFDDVWELEPSSYVWSRRSPDVAPASLSQGLVYDTSRHVLVGIGDDERSTTWELDDTHWMVRGPSPAGLRDPARGFVFDPIRKKALALRMGADSSVTLWDWDGKSWASRTCPGGPKGLYASGVTHDLAHNRVLLVGGRRDYVGGPTSLRELWELDPSSCTWSANSIPSPRHGIQVAWDSKRNVAVAFGGYADTTVTADTWEWNGSAWTVQANAAPVRVQAAMAFDPLRGRMVLFGGFSTTGTATLLDDTWEYDGVSWTKIVGAKGPAARSDASMVWDPDRKRIVLYGGSGPNATKLGDFWEWDGTSWSRRTFGVVPAARSGMSGGTIPTASMAVMFGGARGDGANVFLADTWIWRDGEWLRTSSGEAPAGWDYVATRSPSPRAGHAFAVGFRASGLPSGTGLLFGGEGDSGVLGDTWTWDDRTYQWTEYLPAATYRISPPARTEHAMAVNVDVGYLMFGGVDGAGKRFGDTWTWASKGGWSERTGSGDVPPARSSHAMVADTVRKKIVMFGGRGATGALRDTWEWDMTAASGALGWTKRTPGISPPAMYGHRMVFDPARGKVVLTGGTGDDPEITYGDTWEWDGAAGTWSKRTPLVSLEPRVGHFVAFDAARNEVMVFGGLAYRNGGAGTMTYGDVWSFARATASDAGTARYANGTPCTSSAMCSSGNCVDGVCCNSKCDGQCGACDVAGSIGQCVPASGAPHGARTSCGTDACSPRCDGKDMAACHLPAPGAVCAAPTCTGGMLTSQATCSSSGTCGGTTTTSCAPYACKGAGCATGCYSDADCFSGYFCQPRYYQPGACYPLAKLTSFSLSPTSVRAGQSVTATASATNVGMYRFSYVGADGTLVYPCGGFNFASTCTATMSTAGSFTWRVAAQSNFSSREDDARELTLTVTP